MWSREGIQQFMHRGALYTQKGIHLVEQGVQIAGTLKGRTRLLGWPSVWGAGAPGGVCVITSRSLNSNGPRDIEFDSTGA